MDATATEPEGETSRPGSSIGMIVRVASSLALVGWLGSGVDWSSLGGALGRCQVEWCFVALLAYCSSQTVSVYRWAGLGRAAGFSLPAHAYWMYYFQGMFLSLCLPSSIGGDFYKAWRLGRDQNQYALAVGSVLADRATGLAALLCLASAAWCAQWLKVGPLEMAGMIVGFTLAASVVVWMLCRAADRLTALLRPVPKLHKLALNLEPFYRRPDALAAAMFWSVPVQVLNVATVVFLGFALRMAVPLAGYFSVVPTVALATVLPLSINGIGIREGGLAMGFAPFGVERGTALLLGLLWFGVVLANGLLGAVVLLLDGAAKTPPSPAELEAVEGAADQDRPASVDDPTDPKETPEDQEIGVSASDDDRRASPKDQGKRGKGAAVRPPHWSPAPGRDLKKDLAP